MKKRVLSLVLALVMSFGLTAPALAAQALPFTDVGADAWYYADVAAAHATGLLNGTTATSFDPTGNLTLAQAVTLAARLHQYTAQGEVTLTNGTDVWYSTFVDYAKKNGIINSAYDGRMGDKATRAEMVKILYKALPADRYEPVNDVEDDAIPDVKLSYAYGPEVYAFYRAGILTGSRSTFASVINGEGYFKPQDPIERREVAAILNRMLNPDQRKRFSLSLPELPSPSAKLTEENIFALLDNLDPDGAWILRSADTDKSNTIQYINGVQIDAGNNFMSWLFPFKDGSLRDAGPDQIASAIHEECHAFSHNTSAWNRDYIYIGDGAYIAVDYTATFKTEEMSSRLPESLRTDRYNTYVSAGASASANQFGIYGLLNEYAAYCWCTDASLKLYSHIGQSNLYTNEFVSSAEFRFWILSYMLYARENHPDVYQGILDNDAFRQAFTTIDNKFSQVIQDFFAAGHYLDTHKVNYDKLTAIMERPEYVEMAELLQP